MTEEVHDDTLLAGSVLVEDDDNERALAKQFEDGIQRATLGQRPEASLTKATIDKIVHPFGFERPADKVEQPAVLRKLADAGGGGDLPVAEVARQTQHTPALLRRANRP